MARLQALDVNDDVRHELMLERPTSAQPRRPRAVRFITGVSEAKTDAGGAGRLLDQLPPPAAFGLRCDHTGSGDGMAWDFETEPEFEEQLAWMRAFIDRAPAQPSSRGRGEVG
jgi:hypothetical protein